MLVDVAQLTSGDVESPADGVAHRSTGAQRRPGGRPDDQGTLPAIVNAAYHATGNRVRDLPLTPDTFVE